ncbi:MAG TPA: GNAT family N-acetyltransferase [Patescibacteria group bacterium]
MFSFNEAFVPIDLGPRPQVISIESLKVSDIEGYIDSVLVRIPNFDPKEDSSIIAALSGVYRRRLKLPEWWTMLVAKSERKIVAGLEGEIDNSRKSGKINWVHVDQRFKRNKIATNLYAAYASVLRNEGIDQMTAYVDSQNFASHAFHRSLGFEPLRRSRDGFMYRKSL